MSNRIEDALMALAEHGLRCDMTPTHDMSSLDASEAFWHRYLRMLDANVRQLATNALEAARERPKSCPHSTSPLRYCCPCPVSPCPMEVEAAPSPPALHGIGHVDGLNEATALLVKRFAYAMALKLRAAEEKYGYSDGWTSPDWMAECRAKLHEHIAKGDPRDVAAYCAFLWHHNESTATTTNSAPVDSSLVVGPADSSQGEPVAWMFEGCPYKKLDDVPYRGKQFAVPLYPPPIRPQVVEIGEPRDWSEDWPHENGRYECRCVDCGKRFQGHKRRVVCKLCATQAEQAAKGEGS